MRKGEVERLGMFLRKILVKVFFMMGKKVFEIFEKYYRSRRKRKIIGD